MNTAIINADGMRLQSAVEDDQKCAITQSNHVDAANVVETVAGAFGALMLRDGAPQYCE